MRLNVDIAHDLDLLDALRSRLAVLGVRAEMREHLMSLVVFAAPPVMPVCVFAAQCGCCFSWQGGQERHPVTDLAGAAIRLAASASGTPSRAACCSAAERARTSWGLAELTETTKPGEAAMAEQANAPLRVMTSESSWRSRRSYVGKANQVRHARAFLARVLEGFPLVDDAVLLISELCANVVQHSSSGNPGGMFTVHAEVHEGQYVWAEVGDCGGLWTIKDDRDGRGHGLGIVREIAADWGRDGDPVTGWVVWFCLDWPGADVSGVERVADKARHDIP